MKWTNCSLFKCWRMKRGKGGKRQWRSRNKAGSVRSVYVRSTLPPWVFSNAITSSTLNASMASSRHKSNPTTSTSDVLWRAVKGRWHPTTFSSTSMENYAKNMKSILSTDMWKAIRSMFPGARLQAALLFSSSMRSWIITGALPARNITVLNADASTTPACLAPSIVSVTASILMMRSSLTS